ncbi:TetR/AcrR family transcriptional regulator [Phenylobacterium sp.]|jgi:AcrR family transcriptional regulator|uniref:TetR/AcrR family transcriptional regulator n=1 Tax=Phenylobacterium sp. TaxID=1871053 RepID=UPI0037CC60E4
MKVDTGSIAFASPVRASQKEATRQRVLAAARNLFNVQGYEGTTIRDIARDAGVAAGTVFTSFASKGEILSEVMDARSKFLSGELDRVLPHLRGSTLNRLQTMFGAHIQFEMQHPRLFLAHIAAAYDLAQTPGVRPFGQNAQLRSVLYDCLAKGVEDGDIAADANLDEIVALLLAVQAWTFRMATEGSDARSMIAAMDRRIALIVDGIRPRS